MKTQPSKDDLNRDRLVTKQVLADLKKDLDSKVKADDFDTALVRRINVICEQCFDKFTRMHNIAFTPMSKSDAIEKIRALYRNEVKDWSKDELLEAFCLVQASLGAEAFHNQLI